MKSHILGFPNRPLSSWRRPALLLLLCGLGCNLVGQEARDRERVGPPTLTVTGRGETSAAPDRAVLRLGAVAEDKEAATAQSQVNEVMQRSLQALADLKIPENKIRTAGLSLTPVYEQQERPHGVTRPRIIGYRAYNTLQVELADLKQVGRVLDAGVAAGANQIESVSFELKDDRDARRQALRMAVEEARGKAEVIAQQMGVRLRGVREVTEGGVHIMQPRMELGQARFGIAAAQSTPVQPGEVRIEASVTVQYVLADALVESR